MKQNKAYSFGYVARLRMQATNSSYIGWIDSIHLKSVVVYVRVSDRSQKDHLEHQKSTLTREAESRGMKILATIEEVCEGWNDDERIGFERAVLIAKQKGAFILATSVPRFRRPLLKGTASLNLVEMKKLMEASAGVPLATLIHPDAPAGVVRREESKRGQAWVGNYGGRPKVRFPKKERRLKLAPVANRLREEGLSLREIGRELNVPWRTIRDWTLSRKNHTPKTRDVKRMKPL